MKGHPNMKIVAIAAVSTLLLAGCKGGDLPPENRCSMYWDYYYNAGLGKPVAERQSAEGVEFADIRAIIKADPSEKTKVCQKILKDAFPNDPALQGVTTPIPAAAK